MPDVCSGLDAFGFITTFFLEAQPLTPDGLKILQSCLAIRFVLFRVLSLEFNGFMLHLLKLLQRLLTIGLVVLSMLTLAFHCFLIKLLTPLQSFLLKLLTTGGELLLLLCDLRLKILFDLGVLLACGLQKLFALLTGLFAQLIDLPLRLLTDGGIVHKLIPLPLRLLNNVFRLLTRTADEAVPSFQKLAGTFQLLGESLSYCIQHLHRIRFINEATTAERKSGSLKDHLLKLIQLINHVESNLVHFTGGGKAELNSLLRSFATSAGTM